MHGLFVFFVNFAECFMERRYKELFQSLDLMPEVLYNTYGCFQINRR